MDSKVIQLYIYIYSFCFSSHIGHYRVLSRVPCAAVGPCLLSILYRVVCICSSQAPDLSLTNVSNTHFLKAKHFLKYSCFTMLCQFQVYSKVIQLYLHIYFFRFFFLIGYSKILVEFPVLYSRSLLIIYFVYSGVYMLTPNS